MCYNEVSVMSFIYDLNLNYGGAGVFEVLSSIFKYILMTVIYLFIYAVIRLIYLDIRSVNAQGKGAGKNTPYLKLINRRENLNFKVEETYGLEGNIVIGRSDKNDIFIKDPYISGTHARFTQREDQFFLEDLGSTNGTLINGEQIGSRPVSLKDGDKIHIGQLDFLFVKKSK